MRGVPAAAVALSAFSVAAPARALGPGDIVTVGGGVMAGVGGNFLDKPSNQGYPQPGGGVYNDTTYPGFAGVSSGFGLMIEGRVLGVVGLEIDAIRSSDKAKGDITLNNNPFHVTVGQSAWHVPVLAKGTLPLPLFAPFIEFGPEFVFPSDASAEVTGDNLTGLPRYSATSSSYTMWTGGLGFELKPPIPGLDLRIPLSFRGSINPSVGSNMTDRETLSFSGSGPSAVTFDSRWKYRAYVTLGAAVYF